MYNTNTKHYHPARFSRLLNLCMCYVLKLKNIGLFLFVINLINIIFFILITLLCKYNEQRYLLIFLNIFWRTCAHVHVKNQFSS